MFATIFLFEFKRWLKNPLFYVYGLCFFLIGFLIMCSSIGVFDGVSVTVSSNAYSNSPLALSSFINGITVLTYFLLPTIVGASVYRDFKYQVHHILFSYPFSKPAYLFGKFLSSLLITILITFSIGLGIFVATLLPFANQQLLGSFNLMAYVQPFVLLVIPNLVFIGAIVFAIVTLTRNVYVGFISIIFLLVFQGVLSGLTADMDNQYLAALLDPFGSEALHYYTKYWTVAEQNVKSIPFEGALVYNRLIWFGIALLVLIFLYVKFEFTQQGISFERKKKGQRLTKNNFGSVTKIELPKVHYSFSWSQNLKNAWSFSNLEFKFIVKNWMFISVLFVGLTFMLISSISMGQIFGTNTYPVTWKVLMIQGDTFGFFILFLTFLFAGLLVQRGPLSKMNLLIDVTPVPNWVMLFSKWIALVKMQMVLVLVVVISGVIIQTYHGYYKFELAHYFFELYGINLVRYVIWAVTALMVQTFFKNYLLGFFTLLALLIGIPFLSKIGVEQDIFYLNRASFYSYSDMNGYGAKLSKYYIYALYWGILAMVFFGIALLFWRRGLPASMKERFFWSKKRAQGIVVIPMLVAFMAFLAIGSMIYYEDTVKNVYVSAQEGEKQSAEWEKKYKKYEHQAQPRITDVKINMDLFPETRDFKVQGTYTLMNKTEQTIDSLLVNYNDYPLSLEFGAQTELLSRDTVFHFDIYKLKQPLAPGESMVMKFSLQNKPNTLLTTHSPVLENGTFINNAIFPSFGYSDSGELEDNDVREKYGLGPKDRMALQTDLVARQNTYISSDSDWIQFETTVSTSPDQIAIAPGYLQKEWVENGRRYFHYKMDQKMLNFYAFNSARFEVKKDRWNDVNIEIYYHKGHEYNLDRMIEATKKALTYYSENYSPYQHKQVRIIEFPNSMGTFAQSFANTIPFSEAIGFIAKIDESDEDAVDYPFSVVAHEVAHQWWAHQVIGANVQGATLLSESLSEYSALKVLEHEYGKPQMRKFLKDALDSYLSGRSRERKKEQPLMYNENQQYIHYNKGSLVLYALSDYIGEKTMNDALKAYVKKVAFQEAPYTTATELVGYLNQATPDSLKYLIHDMFETITLYDNKVVEVKSKALKNGKYEVTFGVEVAKYHSDDQGKRIFKDASGKTLTFKTATKDVVNSLPLQDYIEIGVFAQDEKTKKEKVLYLVKRKITQIDNKFTIVVDSKPSEVGVDPYNKLIDTKSNDNRMKI